MGLLKRIFQRLKRTLKFSVSNPDNFREVWSFNSNGIRVLSLFLVFLVVFAFGILSLFGPSWSGVERGKGPVSRKKLEAQAAEIESLSKQVERQEKYINSIRLILLGEVPVKSDIDSLNKVSTQKIDSIFRKTTNSEEKLAAKVKDDMRTKSTGDKKLSILAAPVTGVVSQKFELINHKGIDIVTEKDKTVKACLSGTVIYKGYSQKDGHVLIIEHADGFLSVYKHNKTVFKNPGAKVRTGDPVAVVGNSGENSDGPHLHFELWYNQAPVNPEDYMSFKK